jgi:glucuronoxylan 4-O-methyltransferase
MSLREYTSVLSVLNERAPCNVLIYGVGKDSYAYAAVNEGGRTLFVEGDAEWAQKVAAEHPQLEILRVSYPTTIGEALRTNLAAPAWTTGAIGMADAAGGWDVILVDGPPGELERNPGRLAPISEAGLYAKRRVGEGQGRGKGTGTEVVVVDVFVHDCNRDLEARASDMYLGRLAMGPLLRSVEEYDRSRHYVLVSG